MVPVQRSVIKRGEHVTIESFSYWNDEYKPLKPSKH